VSATTVALIDTNVIIAALDEVHLHHADSATLIQEGNGQRLCVAAHSYAEAFSTLTKRSERAPFGWSAAEALKGLESIAAITELVGLTPPQTLEAVRLYGRSEGTGARLFDFLIGRAAVLAGTDTIVTWNARHFRSLFADRRVETPTEYLVRNGANSDGERPA
jgi:predicted nucleic acid-binding protein